MQTRRTKTAAFFALPANAQRPIDGGCSCAYCKAHPGRVPMWDTLAVSSDENDRTWTVHYPEISGR
jgi:hypothetical protein